MHENLQAAKQENCAERPRGLSLRLDVSGRHMLHVLASHYGHYPVGIYLDRVTRGLPL